MHGLHLQCARKHVAHRRAVVCESRCFDNDRDVDLCDAVARHVHSIYRNSEHLDGISPSVSWIAIGEKLTNIPNSSRTKNGIGDRMCYRIAVRVPHEVAIEWNVDSTELQRATLGEAMRVVAQAYARAHCSLLLTPDTSSRRNGLFEPNDRVVLTA